MTTALRPFGTGLEGVGTEGVAVIGTGRLRGEGRQGGLTKPADAVTVRGD